MQVDPGLQKKFFFLLIFTIFKYLKITTHAN